MLQLIARLEEEKYLPIYFVIAKVVKKYLKS